MTTETTADSINTLVRFCARRDIPALTRAALQAATGTVADVAILFGGTWRYTQSDAQGNSYGFHGVFHGDPSPDAIVQTFEFEGAPGHVCLQTATLAEHGGKTLMHIVSAFQSVQDRDAMVASGMERGVHDSGERLAELLARLQAS